MGLEDFKMWVIKYIAKPNKALIHKIKAAAPVWYKMLDRDGDDDSDASSVSTLSRDRHRSTSRFRDFDKLAQSLPNIYECETVTEFELACENLFAWSNAKDEKLKVSAALVRAVGKLKGPALTDRHTTESFKNLVVFLRRKLNKTEYKETKVARDILTNSERHRQTPNMTDHDYLNRWELNRSIFIACQPRHKREINQCTIHDGVDLLQSVINGYLDPVTRKILNPMLKTFASWDEGMDYFRSICLTEEDPPKTANAPGTVPWLGNMRYRICYRCGRPAHMQRTCKEKKHVDSRVLPPPKTPGQQDSGQQGSSHNHGNNHQPHGRGRGGWHGRGRGRGRVHHTQGQQHQQGGQDVWFDLTTFFGK